VALDESSLRRAARPAIAAAPTGSGLSAQRCHHGHQLRFPEPAHAALLDDPALDARCRVAAHRLRIQPELGRDPLSGLFAPASQRRSTSFTSTIVTSRYAIATSRPSLGR